MGNYCFLLQASRRPGVILTRLVQLHGKLTLPLYSLIEFSDTFCFEVARNTLLKSRQVIWNATFVWNSCKCRTVRCSRRQGSRACPTIPSVEIWRKLTYMNQRLLILMLHFKTIACIYQFNDHSLNKFW